MGDWLDFLSEHREILTWLGGGLAVVASGLWVVVKHFTASTPTAAPKPAPQRQATARDGIAAAGNFSAGRDIRIGDVALPRLALGLAALGMLLLALAAMFGGGDVATNSVTSDGDIEGSNITIGAPAPPPES